MRERLESEDVNAFDDGGFAGVGFRDSKGFEADFAGCEGGGKCVANGADAAVK